MKNEIDIEELRKYIIDYYGTAMINTSPNAIMDLMEIENASDEKVLSLALKNNININNFTK